MRVLVLVDKTSPRSLHIGQSMHAGIMKCGHRPELLLWEEAHFEADVAVGYGWAHPKVMEGYKKRGKHFVYIDLGWWDRKPARNALNGYHKVSVDDRDPHAYFARGFPDHRAREFGIEIKPWRRKGKHILVAGMSAKSAGTYGLAPEEWERAIITRLRAMTDAPILYKFKPSWNDAKPIDGSIFFTGLLEEALSGCHAVVTHHSNVAIDALCAGVPVHVALETVAEQFNTPLADIEAPRMASGGRWELMVDLAWCQWSPRELSSGACWKHLMEFSPLCP